LPIKYRLTSPETGERLALSLTRVFLNSFC
jgi:hypothetical protein